MLYNNLDTEPNVEIDELLDTYDQRYLKEVKEGFDAVVETVRLLLDQIDELKKAMESTLCRINQYR